MRQLDTAPPNVPPLSDPTPALVEYARRGVWRTAPALQLGREVVTASGRFLVVAAPHEEEWANTALSLPETWVEVLRSRRIGDRAADIFTFAQKLPDTERRFGYYAEPVSLAAVRVASFDEWWRDLPQETRKNVRRAEKRGLSLCVQALDDRLVRGIVGVNNDSPVRQGTRFAHYGKTFEQVARDQSSYSDRSYFVCAYLGEELIGFVKLVRCGAAAHIMQFLPKASHQDKRPANALMARAVRLCEEERIEFLVYGQLTYGNKTDSSLRDFKLRNGFEDIFVPRYYVPLTAKGRLALRLGLHRGLVGILPPRAISAATKLRAWWHGLKK